MFYNIIFRHKKLQYVPTLPIKRPSFARDGKVAQLCI